MKEIPEEDEEVMETIVAIFKEAGIHFLYDWRKSFGLNTFYPSLSGGIELEMDYGTPHDVKVARGTFSFGSYSGAGNFDEVRIRELFEPVFEVEVIRPQRDDRKVDYLTYQLCSSGPTYGLK